MGTNCCDICVILDKCLKALNAGSQIYEEHINGVSLAACEYDSATEYQQKLIKEMNMK